MEHLCSFLDGWIFCPICGAERPKGKKEELEEIVNHAWELYDGDKCRSFREYTRRAVIKQALVESIMKWSER